MYFLDLLHPLNKHRFIIVLKANQIGFTWTMAGDNLHCCQYISGANLLNISKGQAEAEESTGYSDFIHNQLPDYLRLSYGSKTLSVIEFPSMNSKMRALPATEDASVGFGGATRVALDEFEYHKFDKKIYGEIIPKMADYGQLIIFSTADKWKQSTKFKELFVAARNGSNDFYPVFFPYDVIPERDLKWYEDLLKCMSKEERECHFPKTEDEALETLSTLPFFSRMMSDQMYSYVREPLNHAISGKFPSVRIYKFPVPGRKYMVYTDPSEGSEDPHATVVTDMTFEEQASSHSYTTAGTVGMIHDELARFYNNAINGWEAGPGGAGGILTKTLDELKTPNRCPEINVSSRPFKLNTTSGKYGWWASKTFNDVTLYGYLEGYNAGQVVMHSKSCIDEHKQYIRPEGGSPQPPEGGHDDWITAWKGIYQLRNYAQTGDARARSWKYKE